jgi:hypothetical protein
MREIPRRVGARAHLTWVKSTSLDCFTSLSASSYAALMIAISMFKTTKTASAMKVMKKNGPIVPWAPWSARKSKSPSRASIRPTGWAQKGIGL